MLCCGKSDKESRNYPRKDMEVIVKLFDLLVDISKTENEEELNDFVIQFRTSFSGLKKESQLFIPDKKGLDNETSLLLKAMSTRPRKKTNKRKIKLIIIFLIENCPEMILLPNKNTDLKGMTPLHFAVLKGDREILKLMSDKLAGMNKIDDAKSCKAYGQAFKNTPMMAGTLLGIASLKFDKNMFLAVLENFPSELHNANTNGDNILHSLITYAHGQPDKKEEALDMLKYIIDSKFARKKEDKSKRTEIVRDLLMAKNKDKRTPLQLAAKEGEFDFFKSIMQHEVYHSVQSDKGAYTEAEYDITEIETLPPTNAEHATAPTNAEHATAPINTEHATAPTNAEHATAPTNAEHATAPTNAEHATDHEHIKDDNHESVLEYIIHHQTANAFHFAGFVPVREVIKEKWRFYRPRYVVWLVIHFTFMVVLSVTALYRSKLTETTYINDAVKFEYILTKNIPVTVTSVIGCVLGILHFILEYRSFFCIKRFQYKTSPNLCKSLRRAFSSPYSNAVFRFFFLLFYALLIIDFLVEGIKQGSVTYYSNSCLIFAVILGWYLVMFFLQVFKPIGFFTVLIQRAILDMLKFGFVMLIFLVAFSIAMFMIMQGADTEEDDFNNFGKTMVKMLTIMLGIGDLDILFKARQPILAIIVFVVFVCLTTILLLNALIALMSNSCTDLMSSYRDIVATKYHCRLQRLSVILYLESFLKRDCCKEVGFIKSTNTGVQRRFWSSSSIQEYREDESETSVNALNNADKSFSLWDFIKIKRKHNKIASNTKRKMTKTNTSMLPGRKIVDITDIQRQTCKKCYADAVVVSQTQEIAELPATVTNFVNYE